MKFLILFLLGTALAEDVGPAASRRRRLKHDVVERTECMKSFKRDERDGCDLFEDVTDMGKAVIHARNVIGGCPTENSPRTVILIRDDQSWVYTTSTPKEAFTAMIKFLRQASEEIDNDHKLLITYKYNTRIGGQARTLIVKGNMDLWAAFLLQEEFHTVELYVALLTVGPTAVPTTATPTAVPTTAKPTLAIVSKFLSPTDDVGWLNSLIKRLKLKLRPQPCYSMSRDGKNQATFRKNCGYGKGPWMVAIKTTKNHVFGAYSDVTWTDQGGTYFYCRECFLWILKGRTYTKKQGFTYRYHNYAQYHHTSYGPTFGGGHDLSINSPSSPSGYANTGHTYKSASGGYPYYIDVSSGSGFSITDWEVFPAVPIIDGDFYTRIIEKESDRKWLNSLLPTGRRLGTRCYSMYYGMGHTSKATSYFRNSCSGRSPIMFTARVGSYIFGGYSGIQWSKSSSGYAKSPEAFLWILNGIKHTRKKIGQNGKTPQYATYHNTSYGPCFGSGHDMCVSSPGSPSGYGKIGSTYTPPSGSNPYYITSTSSASWTLADWEVHLVVDDGSY